MCIIHSLEELPEDELYQNFFAKKEIVKNCIEKGELYKTYWNGDYSDNSCSFVDYNKDHGKNAIIKTTVEKLESIFQMSNKELFEAKFKQAISGDGQEWKRIATLHSSSLVALLCFYSVTNSKPLTINVDGNDCIFTESHFECKNRVGIDGKGNPHYSNMDVVLIGKTKENKSVILFLESKFSEYLKNEKYSGISAEVYDKIYSELKEMQIPGLKLEKSWDEWSISAAKNNPQYCGGIKQMISHYQGITNSFIGSMCDRYDNVLLGEILFDFGEKIGNDKFSNYSETYNQLADKLNIINKVTKFKVVTDILSYKKVFENFSLDDNVKAFYSL